MHADVSYPLLLLPPPPSPPLPPLPSQRLVATKFSVSLSQLADNLKDIIFWNAGSVFTPPTTLAVTADSAGSGVSTTIEVGLDAGTTYAGGGAGT